MKLFEYNPFPDVYIPYIVYTNNRGLFWEKLLYSRMPYFTRWIIYQTFRGMG